MILNWIGYHLAMHLDAAINPYTAFGRWCLVRAGAWAYRDHDYGDDNPSPSTEGGNG